MTDVSQALLRYNSLVVFTQYTDTMDYVRERLIAAGITKIGCYSGRGGQIYNDNDNAWSDVSKAVIKDQFRGGELTVLIGTDSMSEGLNLQTSGRLINYDMPWNLMRVEQRIGRIDRIGASYKNIAVTNYFYADTVEQRVYEGIAEDYGDFTDIIGDAAPVLANIEKAIEQLALGDASDEAIEKQVDALKGQVENLNNNAINASDLGDSPEVIGHIEYPPELHGDTDLDDLEAVLTTNPLTRPQLTPVDDTFGVYRLMPPVQVAPNSFASTSGTTAAADYLRGPQENVEVLVTFDRDISDHSRMGITLLTFGTPELESLLPGDAEQAK